MSSLRILFTPASLTENLPGIITVRLQEHNSFQQVWEDVNLSGNTVYNLTYRESIYSFVYNQISSTTTSSNPGAVIIFLVSIGDMPPVGNNYELSIERGGFLWASTTWSGGGLPGLTVLPTPPSNFVITQGTGIKSLNSIISANCPYFDKDANLSMNGKNILGINNLEVTNFVAPLSVAKICMGTHIIPEEGEKGYLSFDIKEDIDAVTIPYLKLNGNTTDIDMLRPLKMNNKDISDIGTATTFNSNQLVPQRVLYASADANIPNITDDGCRFVAINAKEPINYGTATPIVYGDKRYNVTASALYNNLWWVGTDRGQLFYYDTGAWILQATGTKDDETSRINCLQVYDTYLAVGGSFKPETGGTYHCLYAIQAMIGSGVTTYLLNTISSNVTTHGTSGDEVKCFYDNAVEKCLYIGGTFSFDIGTNGLSTSFITFKYDSEVLYNVFNTSSTGYNGFYKNGNIPGTVNSISVDSNTRIFVGGDFDIVYRGGVAAINSTPYLHIWRSSDDGITYSADIAISEVFNGPVSSLLEYETGKMLIGGSFALPFGNGMLATYSIEATNYIMSEYPLISGGPSAAITFIQKPLNSLNYIFTALNNNILYRSSDITRPIITTTEVDSWNCVAYNGTDILFASDTQNSLKDNAIIGLGSPSNGDNIEVSNGGVATTVAKVNLTMNADNTVGSISITSTGIGYFVGDLIKIGTADHYVQISSLNVFEAAILNGALQNFDFHTYEEDYIVTLTSLYNNIRSTSYSTLSRVTLLNVNSSVELIWNNTLSSWFILSQQGASFS